MGPAYGRSVLPQKVLKTTLVAKEPIVIKQVSCNKSSLLLKIDLQNIQKLQLN